ncbi:hypothetical protein ACF08B_39475 [Streptomyces sp. NPDC015139]|uniref:hypothetical protein n=1 Tax=Streptomyces sp. NPDC015139 TaxID=3364942 RepID=UPI0036FE0BB8
MTPSSPRPPRLSLRLITAVLLTVAGIWLLTLPAPLRASPSSTPPPTPAVSAGLPSFPARAGPDAPAAGPTSVERSAAASSSAPAPHVSPRTPSAPLVRLPPHGEGPAGDRAIQRVLEAAWPADLTVGDERQLLAAGRDLLRADATGIGRARWPAVFGPRGRAVAPAFAAVGFRVQAAVARRDGAPGRAVVHLVWAGTDRGGTFTDGRVTDLHFTRTTTKGVPTWTAKPSV